MICSRLIGSLCVAVVTRKIKWRGLIWRIGTMSSEVTIKYAVLGDGKKPLSDYDEVSMTNIGQDTYKFVRRLMRNPEYREKIRQKAAELKAAGIC